MLDPIAILLAQNTRYNNAIDGFKTGLAITGIGIIIAGLSVFFSKSKDASKPQSKLQSILTKLVGFIVICLGVGLIAYGQTF